MVLERTEMCSWASRGAETKNDRTAEGQQQITCTSLLCYAMLCSVFKGLIEAKHMVNSNTVDARRTTYRILILYMRTHNIPDLFSAGCL
jgi:hypothetical protein